MYGRAWFATGKRKRTGAREGMERSAVERQSDGYG